MKDKNLFKRSVKLILALSIFVITIANSSLEAKALIYPNDTSESGNIIENMRSI